MKTTRILFALCFIPFLASCGGGEKQEGADSTQTPVSATPATPVKDCPAPLIEAESAFNKYVELVGKVRRGETVTAEEEDAVKLAGSESKNKLMDAGDLSEDCKLRMMAINWAQAYADMAEARAIKK